VSAFASWWVVLAGILLVLSMPVAAGQSPTGVPEFIVCYNYGCKHMERVSRRVVRSPFVFDLHWAGKLVERATQQHYAVDSWCLDNGGLPYIQPLDEWQDKQPFKQAATGVLDDS
jgi:hypothetical protein